MITERRLFALLSALTCLPVWLVTWFPSQDGPSHLYNARVLMSLMTDAQAAYGEWYRLTPGLTTNLTGHVLLAALSGLFPPAVAEKAVVTLCILLFGWGVRYALSAVREGGAWLATLALPAASGVFLHLGFYSFLLGVGLYSVACGYWFRRWGAFRARETACFAALLAALFASHILPWAAAMVVIGVPALWVSATRGSFVRYLLPTCVAAAPSVVLLLIYLAHARGSFEAGPLFPVRSAVDLLIDNPVVSFARAEVLVFAGLSFVLAVLAAFVLGGKAVRPHLTPYDWLGPLSVLLFVSFLAAPARAMGGSYLRSRLWLIAGITMLLWIGAQRFGARDRHLIAITGAILTVAMAWSHWNSYRALEPYLREAAAVRRIIHGNSTILGLRYSQSAPVVDGQPLCLRIDCFLHAGAYAAHVPGDILADNYEASTGHFPISWRTDWDMGAAGTLDSEPPCVDLGAWHARTAGQIDYVMLTGYPKDDVLTGCAEATLRQLRQGYELVFRSNSRFVQVYRRRQE